MCLYLREPRSGWSCALVEFLHRRSIAIACLGFSWLKMMPLRVKHMIAGLEPWWVRSKDRPHLRKTPGGIWGRAAHLCLRGTELRLELRFSQASA
jgi:hypothetical protein